jgi:hypothetical protein
MTIGTIVILYACMSLSLLVNKRRGLFTFGAFIVVSIFWQIVTSYVFKLFFQFQTNQFSIVALHQLMAMGVVGSIATIAVFYFITRIMLSRKLNIE